MKWTAWWTCSATSSPMELWRLSMVELKPGWMRAKFAALTECVNDRVDDPSKAGVDRYVGLDHLDPESLTIRRWGTPEEVESTKLRFKRGDIIFGKRRAYQRKLAVADFDGICSAHAMVLRAKRDAVLPEFLPYFMQSDTFMERAVAISVGSLSPTINWKTLAAEEFALPPLKEQRRIVSLLGAVRLVEERANESVDRSRAVLDAALLETFRGLDRKPLQQLCRADVTYGIVQAGPDIPGGVPYVRVSEMTNRECLDASEMLRTTSDIAAQYRRTVLELGDLVVALRGVPGLTHVVDKALVGGNLSRGVARVAHAAEIHHRYLLWALRSPTTQAAVLQYANGWKGEDLREITISELRTLPVPVMPRVQQDAVVARLDQLDSAWTWCRSRRNQAVKALTTAVRNHALQGHDQ
ncbi:MAG: restriction endonuclease subunit S [Polyangiaceae bacterium]